MRSSLHLARLLALMITMFLTQTAVPGLIFDNGFEDPRSDCGPPPDLYPGANLTNCNLSGLDLTNTDLTGANFDVANEVECEVTAFDGIDSSSSVLSNTVTITEPN